MDPTQQLMAVQLRRYLFGILESSGFLKRLEQGGPELARARHFFMSIGGQCAPAAASPGQAPWLLPPFPGLRHQPFHDSAGNEAVRFLESQAEVFREEASALTGQALIPYDANAVTSGEWTAYPFHSLGVPVESHWGRCPRTDKILRALPDTCFRYAWGDALYSAHAPGTHLRPHCSVDDLRLRCHLGVIVPEGATLRVGSATRSWEPGRALLFEDSFEHEVWNRGASSRVVLIVDFWHPGLTAIERRAITAAFLKREVRMAFLRVRIPPHLQRLFHADLAAGDSDPVMREFFG